MASTKLTRTPSSVGNSKTWTYSMWIKLGNITTEYVLFHNYGSSGSDEVYAKIGGSSGVIDFALRYGGTYEGRLITNRKFRDPSAWYHLVFACDTTSGTATNRQRIYVNGVEETDFSTDTQITQNAGTVFNQAYEHTIGSYGSGNYFDGEMAHVHMTDGAVYAASDFGEFNSTSGIWIPKTAPSVTYGTNGFFLKFENSAAMGTDSSGNSNTYAVSGTMTQSNDTPTNLFMCWNPLDNKPFLNTTFSNANTTIATGSSYTGTNCNMWLTQGKWYWEIKCVSKTGDNDHYSIGIDGADPANGTNQYPAAASKSWMIDGHSGNVYNNNSGTSYGNTFGAGDIIGIALDLTNAKLYFSKNGVWQNSSDPTSGSTGTGAVSITAAASTDIRCYIPCATFWSSSSGTFDLNAGGGYFGTTAVASANADANGNGEMEYAVPSGYYTLCTNNIKEFGI